MSSPDATTGSARVLLLFAHPAYQKSRINRALITAAREVKNITVHDLYETYPDLMIDVDEEQKLLDQHDVIVFQHPFFWYSSPAIIKEWLDLVLTYGWAFGEGGDALRGKLLAQAISTGGPDDSYRREGSNYFSMRELLAPFEQTARLCGLHYAQPFVTPGVQAIDEEGLASTARRYQEWLGCLKAGQAPLWLKGY